VGRVVPGEYQSYGHFVIDVPDSYHEQNAILSLLTEDDRNGIGWHLHIIQDRQYDKLPPDLNLQLSAVAANQMDLPKRETFKSAGGYRIWATPQSRIVRL
jgi:hypothetical protein